MLVVGNPVKMSRLAEGPVAPFPGLGEHSDALLADELGLDAEALSGLRARGVI
jgi:crotonobetainyl-CoA:carnitine CoA-transferase CaiB-like acyl-CoA transferase